MVKAEANVAVVVEEVEVVLVVCTPTIHSGQPSRGLWLSSLDNWETGFGYRCTYRVLLEYRVSHYDHVVSTHSTKHTQSSLFVAFATRTLYQRHRPDDYQCIPAA